MPRRKIKTDIITLRLPPRTKQVLREMAQEAGMTLTDYLCVCGLGRQIVRVDGLDSVLSELKAQGRNLNQLTTLANMGRITVLRSDELIDGYTKLYAELQRLLEEASTTWRRSRR